MARTMGHSPDLYHYLKRYQDDPDSRVFAPLAESYRKAGLIDEAIEIAREGVQKHPSFMGGKVALARALFDRSRYDEVIDVLGLVVRNAPDNLAAQKLFSESHLMLGNLQEALMGFKVLLYYHPADNDVAQVVSELETKLIDQHQVIHSPGQENYNIKPVKSIINEDPQLVRDAWRSKIEVLQDLLQGVERYRKETNLED